MKAKPVLIIFPMCDRLSIIEPLASRCSKFRFRALDIGSTEERLHFIADKEGVAREEGVRPSPYSHPLDETNVDPFHTLVMSRRRLSSF